ncbi:hypothetical protein AB1L88_14010 [Tautonia sp. JC769]|uniref:sulfotransferase family protein n=1 Tax=Tautonia sp. JC769 TaxID=3232135 RepID=UPI0034592AAE
MNTALLVLGMHRSGTSALTRVLSLLGAELPRNLIPAVKESNELGHWESIDLLAVHDEMLAAVGSSWHDVTAFPEPWGRSDAAGPFRDRILAILGRDHRDAPLFVVKDPRVCRFVPFWLDLIDRFGASPRAIIPLRNPLEVATSLERRDGFPIAKGALLWLRHALDAERATRDRPRSVITYDALLDDWAATAETIRMDLGLGAWPKAPQEAAAEVDAFLSTSHRHHRADRDALRSHPGIPPWVAQAYEALIELSRDDGPASRDRLDAIRAELAAAEGAFAPLLADLDRHRAGAEDRLQSVEHQAATLEARRITLEGELAAAQEQSAAASRRVAELEAALTTTQEQSAAASRRIAALEADLGAAREANEQQSSLLRRLVYESQQAIERDMAILDRIDAVERRGMVIEAASDRVLASLREAEARAEAASIPDAGGPGRRWWRHWPGPSAVAHHLKPTLRRILGPLRAGAATNPDEPS